MDQELKCALSMEESKTLFEIMNGRVRDDTVLCKILLRCSVVELKTKTSSILK